MFFFCSRTTPSLQDNAIPAGQRHPSRTMPSRKDNAIPRGQRHPSRTTPSLEDNAIPGGQRHPSRTTPSRQDNAIPRGQRHPSRTTPSLDNLKPKPRIPDPENWRFPWFAHGKTTGAVPVVLVLVLDCQVNRGILLELKNQN